MNHMEDQEKTIEKAKEMADAVAADAAEAKKTSADEARQILMQEAQENIQKCWQEIGETLQKYGLQFDVSTTLQGNSISHNINLVPAPPRQTG